MVIVAHIVLLTRTSWHAVGDRFQEKFITSTSRYAVIGAKRTNKCVAIVHTSATMCLNGAVVRGTIHGRKPSWKQ